MARRDRPKQLPDYETMGEVPSAATGPMLHGDPMAQLSTTRTEQARAVEPTRTAPGSDSPTLVRTAASEDWAPLMLAIPEGVAVEIIGRDDDRETFDVTNQSQAITGETALLFLFRDQASAEDFAKDGGTIQASKLAAGALRMVILPDGAGRTFTHTASMWAVAYQTDGGIGGGAAVIDVSAERRKRYIQ